MISIVKRSKGSLSKATKRTKKTGKVTVSDMAKTFKVGEKVVLNPIHVVQARPPMRYAGRHGTITEKRGRSYVVMFMDGGVKKQIITTSIHLLSG